MSKLITFWLKTDWYNDRVQRRCLWFISYALSVVLIFASCLSLKTCTERRLFPKKYSEYVEAYSAEYSLSCGLVYAIVLCESGYDKNAVSPAGACGLMQLMPATFEWVCDSYGIQSADIFSPKENIHAGCAYIAYLSGKFTDVGTLIAAYNAGEGRVSEWLSDSKYSSDGISLDNIPFKETDRYVERVIAAMNKYKAIYSL